MAIRRSYVTFFNHNPGDVDRRIIDLERRINQMAGELAALQAALQAQATQTTDKIQEAVLLLNQLFAMWKDSQTGGIDPVALGNVTTTLKAATDALSAAVTANTPPPPAP